MAGDKAAADASKAEAPKADVEVPKEQQPLEDPPMAEPKGEEPKGEEPTAEVKEAAAAPAILDAARKKKGVVLPAGMSKRALAAGGKKVKGLDHRRGPGSTLASYQATHTGLARQDQKYLVIGDGCMGPFMALALKAHGIECDLAHHQSTSDMDRGTIVLTPSVTQLLGDVLNVSVPSGSVIGRVLVFDHVGNDMCDLDLNEFREKGESPTFFACDRPKIEAALLSLCRVGQHACNVMPKATIPKGGIEPLGDGVRVTFNTGVTQEYKGVICTARDQRLVPELAMTNDDLQRLQENKLKLRDAAPTAFRWLEVCIPPLPELGKFEKRFTPGSQEIVEIMTPREAKMTVRPTMMATKLFYNVSMVIPDSAADPRLRATSMKTFWDDVIEHWTAGVPGYVSHTMFRPMFMHMQQHFQRNTAVTFRSPRFVLPHWSEGDHRIIKVGPTVHGTNFDCVDIADAQSFSDCFALARTLSGGEDVGKFLEERRLQVQQEQDYHDVITNYALKERSQFKYMASRFGMKIMRRYVKSWRGILNNYVTVLPKALPK